jgi:hypothetical protein
MQSNFGARLYRRAVKPERRCERGIPVVRSVHENCRQRTCAHEKTRQRRPRARCTYPCCGRCSAAAAERGGGCSRGGSHNHQANRRRAEAIRPALRRTRCKRKTGCRGGRRRAPQIAPAITAAPLREHIKGAVAGSGRGGQILVLTIVLLFAMTCGLSSLYLGCPNQSAGALPCPSRFSTMMSC